MSNELTTINFHGDEIVAYEDEETGKVNVNVRRICESLGVNFTPQFRKLKQSPLYSKGLSHCSIATEAGERKSLFLDSELLQSWLQTIQVARVKPELREKLLAFQLEGAEALHNHFMKGFSINEQAYGQAPDIVIKGLADKIDELSSKLDNRSAVQTPTVSTDELVVRRMNVMGKIFDVLGKPDDTIIATLRNQVVAELMGGPPAPTLQEQDHWYVFDFFQFKKKEGFLRSSYYISDSEVVKVLGRYASRESREKGIPIPKQNQIIGSGRVAPVGMYSFEVLEHAFKKMLSEGKVERKADAGYL